ncbi:MAG: acetolactate synthase, large subunit, biosynthetic type [Desulfomicrobiaceae bacterium]|jgi:acetolactate synthase-1/2/3 large subunit|nr:acetolactate synthase, large subunit, biosynthetic type [Desulfomicrobiaceae bacterium]MDI3492130.1 acetolactate synthase large subunit [Desulfomicrobiaceae bacterium]MDK2872475.1 acetolactate synthase large subunit [Desulfomicrobiaceae bacterium]HCF05898.1 biosynthetic-type acetolactate synthase large subunit [Desulfomicrobiaceae bacterium]
MVRTGAQILLECLQREGVDLIFGFPGGAVIDIYDELPNHPIRHILVRHEQGAVHAADGYARASGKVGVCLVTSGPGATNTVTGIATAYMDSVPLVIFTGQVPTQLIGNDAFQEADIVGITRPCTKHNYLVKDVRQLAFTVKQAFYLARTGRPGPVLVDLPKDVIRATAEFHYPESMSMRSYNPRYSPNRKQLRRAAELIAASSRPVVYAGGGVIAADGAGELTRLARDYRLPVTTTLMGLGAFPGTDPLWLGMLGMHGTYTANMAINNADLLISIGARFDDRVTGRVDAFAPQAKIIHFDIDPTSISKNVGVDVPIVADCRQGLVGLMEELARVSGVDWQGKHAAWLAELAAMQREHPLTYASSGEHIKPQWVVEKIYEITQGEAIITTEVGQNQMWAAQFYRYTRPRTFLSSGGLGTMGYGFPAAIGAQLAFPDRLVVDIAGDGSIQMNIQELATAVSYQIPVKVVILNNGYLGMVRQWQELFYNKNYCATCLHTNPDFVALAKAYGAEGFRVERIEDVEPVLRKAFAHPGPVFVDVRVEPEENVAPMVPAGAALSEMLLV